MPEVMALKMLVYRCLKINIVVQKPCYKSKSMGKRSARDLI